MTRFVQAVRPLTDGVLWIPQSPGGRGAYRGLPGSAGDRAVLPLRAFAGMAPRLATRAVKT